MILKEILPLFFAFYLFLCLGLLILLYYYPQIQQIRSQKQKLWIAGFLSYGCWMVLLRTLILFVLWSSTPSDSIQLFIVAGPLGLLLLAFFADRTPFHNNTIIHLNWKECWSFPGIILLAWVTS